MARTSAYYRERAATFREFAVQSDDATAGHLINLAEEFEAEALRLDDDPPLPSPFALKPD
jgi:hypothetical protein